jgi:hypothetical protein
MNFGEHLFPEVREYAPARRGTRQCGQTNVCSLCVHTRFQHPGHPPYAAGAMRGLKVFSENHKKHAENRLNMYDAPLACAILMSGGVCPNAGRRRRGTP